MTTTEVRRYRPPVVSDLMLVLLTVLLLGFGLLMLYSTTGNISQERFGDPLLYVKKQSLAAFIGLIGMALAASLPPRLLERASPYCFGIAIFLLAFPLIPGIGHGAGGATRWIRVLGIQFQPGEFVKLLFVIFLAGYLARQESRVGSFLHGILIPAGFIAVIGTLFLLQPDFGSTALVGVVSFAMILAAGAPLRSILLSGVGGASLMGLLVLVSPYRMARVLSFLHPEADPSGKGYQLLQSLIAVSSGQLGGVGLGSSQQKLFFLPAAHTDFIFAVVAEELGFLGGIALLAVFMLFLWRGLRVARGWIDDTFFFCLALGCTLLIVVPALLNFGVVLGLLPTKGMVLPLVSYGGTNLIVSLVIVGILLSLARDIRR